MGTRLQTFVFKSENRKVNIKLADLNLGFLDLNLEILNLSLEA